MNRRCSACCISISGSGDLCEECALKRENARLRARVEKLEKGMKDIIRHYELIGGNAAKFSSVVNIAVNALSDCPAEAGEEGGRRE